MASPYRVSTARVSWVALAFACAASGTIVGCSARTTEGDTSRSDATDVMGGDLEQPDVQDPDVVVDDVPVPEDNVVVDVPIVPDVPVTPDGGADAGPIMIGPMGGRVDRMRFAVFGDIRPALPIPGSAYPSMVFSEVMTGIDMVNAQFAVATGDYMNSNFCESCVNNQLDLLLAAERRFRGYVFHSMGNHECNTVTSINCPNEDESSNIRVSRMRLLSAYAHSWYDFTVTTSLGDAHFIMTSPNTWNAAQLAWLNMVLMRPAMYTFLIAHEPPGDPGPGTAEIENAIRTRAGGITFRFYGHVHNYQHPFPNATITGNAGAPLSGGNYGFVLVDQRADGNLVVTAYNSGRPPMVHETFVIQPNGMLGR